MKNPEESLERLRKSSLLEFEHLKKPEHPEPPLRALPEHSVPVFHHGADAGNQKAKAPYGLDGTTDEEPAPTKEPEAQEDEEKSTSDKPVFKESVFDAECGAPPAGTAGDDLLSPTGER
jgi:glycogenin glucosyltransferase